MRDIPNQGHPGAMLSLSANGGQGRHPMGSDPRHRGFVARVAPGHSPRLRRGRHPARIVELAGVAGPRRLRRILQDGPANHREWPRLPRQLRHGERGHGPVLRLWAVAKTKWGETASPDRCESLSSTRQTDAQLGSSCWGTLLSRCAKQHPGARGKDGCDGADAPEFAEPAPERGESMSYKIVAVGADGSSAPSETLTVTSPRAKPMEP